MACGGHICNYLQAAIWILKYIRWVHNRAGIILLSYILLRNLKAFISIASVYITLQNSLHEQQETRPCWGEDNSVKSYHVYDVLSTSAMADASFAIR